MLMSFVKPGRHTCKHISMSINKSIRIKILKMFYFSYAGTVYMLMLQFPKGGGGGGWGIKPKNLPLEEYGYFLEQHNSRLCKMVRLVMSATSLAHFEL